MKDKAFQNAATQLYNSGDASYKSYKYEDALEDFELSYKYDKSYSTPVSYTHLQSIRDWGQTL